MNSGKRQESDVELEKRHQITSRSKVMARVNSETKVHTDSVNLEKRRNRQGMVISGIKYQMHSGARKQQMNPKVNSGNRHHFNSRYKVLAKMNSGKRQEPDYLQEH